MSEPSVYAGDIDDDASILVLVELPDGTLLQTIITLTELIARGRVVSDTSSAQASAPLH